MVSSAEVGHSVDPPIVVVVVPPCVVVVAPFVVVVPPSVVVVVPPIKVVVVVPSVVVVPPGMVVVVGGNVEIVVLVDVVTVVDEVVVVESHGQSSTTLWPTAFFKQTSASLAVVLFELLGSQTHAGVQVSEPTAVRKMNRQSEAVGFAPLVTG
jgi:hypothetical protein